MRPLRLVVFDSTDTGPLAVPRIERDADGAAHGTGGLTRWWRLGGWMHRGAGRASGAVGATSWHEAIAWALAQADRFGAPITELQAWGHGGWGYMGMGSERLDDASIAKGGSLQVELDRLGRALAPDALVWLRCCSAFGHTGRSFAERLAGRLGARVAGHTYIIGAWQSGTHSLRPGERAAWPAGEGLDEENGAPRRARLSTPGEPHTVSCFRLGLPSGW